MGCHCMFLLHCFSNVLGVLLIEGALGEGYLDLAFIDHSDNYQECLCDYGDLFYDCGNLLNSNVSLCEEKQFTNEVLKADWLWNSAKQLTIYPLNVTNSEAVATGGAVPIIQEIEPLLVSSNGGAVVVDRDMLDNNGILSYSTKRVWHGNSAFQQLEVIVPHFVFATLVANKANLQTIAMMGTDYPAYYPLFTKVSFEQYVGLKPGVQDYISQSRADQEFTVWRHDFESMKMSFFTSRRHGVQGLGFIHSVWNGVSDHCGYDKDCAAPASALKNERIKIKLESVTSYQASICQKQNTELKSSCSPNTVKYAANGIPEGVSSFRTLPSARFYGSEEAEAMWNYQTFSKVGTTWPGLEMVYFILFDVVLAEEVKFFNIHVHRWTISNYHRRTESCSLSASDSPGIDCSSPPNLLSIGRALDGEFPGPLYFSQSEVRPENGGATFKACDGPLECRRPLLSSFESMSNQETGGRICFRDSQQLTLHLQQSPLFSNGAFFIPLYWRVQHFCSSSMEVLRIMRSTSRQIKHATTDAFFGSILLALVYATISLIGFYKCMHFQPDGQHDAGKHCQ